MLFNHDYYEQFCKENGYLRVCETFRKYGYDFSYNLSMPINKDATLVTAGFGMNNAPHIMTALQIIRMINLQKAGYKTQIVLGDYDVLLARDYKNADELSNIYKAFVLSLGYCPEKGTIRNQTAATDVAANVVLLSYGLDDNDFDYVREDLYNYYETNDSMSFPTKVSIVLMLSDFITPLINHQVSSVIVSSGIDESKYVVLANKIVSNLGIAGSVQGLFTKIVAGLNGHPKMSKSKPASGIFLYDSPDTIRTKLADSISIDKDSLQYQLAVLSETSFSKQEIDAAFESRDKNQINTIMQETALFIIDIADKWKAVYTC